MSARLFACVVLAIFVAGSVAHDALAATPATIRAGHTNHPHARHDWRVVSHTTIVRLDAKLEIGVALRVPRSIPGCTKTVTRDRNAPTPTIFTTFWCSS